MDRAHEILEYWLGPEPERDAPEPALRQRWFTKSEATDRELRERFGDDLARVARGQHDDWAQTPRGRLALVILLDQFTRNIHRGTGRMFENDDKALALALAGVDAGEDQRLRAAERQFLYMPLMHAEQLPTQERCCELFEALERAHPALVSSKWAEAHRAIIARFGRFPHRNALLGRASTPEEEAFLQQPGSSF